MRNFQKSKPLRWLSLAVFAAVLGAALLLPVQTAHAASNDTAATVKYCKNQMPKKLDSACTTNNMDRIRNAVRNRCKGKSDVDACIENAAENFIGQIKSKNPQNVQDFNNTLNDLLSSSNGTCNGANCGPTPTGQGSNCDNNHCDLINLYVNPAIKLLSILVGLVVAASLVLAGIQYMTSTGDPQRISAAKTRITNTLLAFLAYAFLFAFLNFLVPGGLF
jgi:hypothetical protein